MAKLTRLLRKYWWVLLLLIVVGGFLVIRSRSMAKAEYAFEKPQSRTVEETIEVSGRVDATRKATLKFLGGGKVTYLPVQEGQTVRKWQTIASIDASDLKKSLQKDLNDYMSSRLTFEQGKEDRKDLALTDAVRRLADMSQFTLNNSVIDVELANIALKNASLYSPLDGIVTKVPVDTAGVQITAADAFEIVDPTSLIFEAEVDEIDIGRVSEGMEVRITLDAYPDKPITGTIYDIALAARASTSSSGGTVFPIKVLLPQADIFTYRLGLNGTMHIIRARAQGALSVPVSATLEKDEKTYVLVRTTGDKTEEREVKIGTQGDEYVEILSGLSLEDEIAISK